MNVLIAGGGRVGSTLASELLADGHRVRLLEYRAEVLDLLQREIPTEVIYEGDPLQPEVLELAGIREAEVLAAVMSDDAHNLAVAALARFHYQVARIIARVNNPRSAWIFSPEMGVDVALNQVDIVGNLIREEMSLGDMMTLLKLRRGAYSLVEEKIPARAQAVGMAIKDLDLPKECVIAAIIRDGVIQVPRGDTRMQAGDEVLALTDQAGAVRLASLFAE